MTSRQTAFEVAQDKMQKGELTAAQANVLMVQIEGVRVIRGKLNSDVRKALNEAVKTGELGHIKRDGLKPEVYHHKNARANAIDAREREMRNGVNAISKVFGGEIIGY